MMPGTANTDVRNKQSSNMRPHTGSMDDLSGTGPNKINIVAKKRPPPMNIGFNDHGIEMTR